MNTLIPLVIFVLQLNLPCEHSHTAPETLYPPEKLDTNVLSRWNNGYSEARFREVLQAVHQVYQPVIGALGGELVLQADWSDGAVNMWAERWGDRYILEIPGGFARYNLINEEAFVLTICHELGHLFGSKEVSRAVAAQARREKGNAAHAAAFTDIFVDGRMGQ